MDTHQVKLVQEALLAANDMCRASVMDTCEQALGSSDDWEFIRSRILRAFGSKAGMEARIRTTFARYLPSDDGEESVR